MELAQEFGEVVVELGFATADEVREARNEERRIFRSERRRVYLAEVLLRRGVLNASRLARALDQARGYRELGDDPSPRLGEIAIAKAYASPLQVWESLVEQRDEVLAGSSRRLLGDVMVERCRLTPWELEDVLVTAAELAAGSLRSGATPSDAIPVGPGLYGGGDVYARRYRRDAVREQVRTVSPPPATRPALARDAVTHWTGTTPDALVGEVLDQAADADAEAILVFRHGELVGVACRWELGDLDASLPVAKAMRAPIVLEPRRPLSDVVALLRDRDDVPFVPVMSGGAVHGVVTPRALRIAGSPIEHSSVELGGSD